MVKDRRKREQGQGDQRTKNGRGKHQTTAEGVDHIPQQRRDGGEREPQRRTGKTVIFWKNFEAEDTLGVTVAVEVAGDGSEAELEVQFADGERFGARPRVDGVVAAHVPRHSDASRTRLDKVFAVAQGFVGREERAPNLPLLVSQIFKAPRQAVFEFNVGEA